MPVDTKKIRGRRKVRYESLDELFADAERLCQQEVRPLGNWTQGQLYEHLARSLNSSIDGVDFKLPAPARWMMTLLLKKKFLHREIPPGFRAPATKLLPAEISSEEGLASLEKAIQRQKLESRREPHPAFGKIGRRGWELFHLRHAEMHMSFLSVASESAAALSESASSSSGFGG